MSRRPEHVRWWMSDVGCEPPSRRGRHIPHPTSPIRHRAFTLAEVTLSIAITSILLLGMGGALSLAVRAADTGDDGPGRATAASESLSSLNAELSVATQLPTFEEHAFTLTVPDRDADGRPERIDYTWDKPGDPMLRSYNGSTPSTFIASVQSCTPQLAERPAAQPVESAERVLAQCDTPAGATLSTFNVITSEFISQYVRPTLPSGATSWKITRIQLFISKSGGHRNFRVSIVAASAALKPSATILATTTQSTSSLSSTAAWVEFALPVSAIAPGSGVVILVDTIDSAKVNVDYAVNGGATQPFNTHMMTSTDGGATWSAPNDTQDIRFLLYGTYTTMVEP